MIVYSAPVLKLPHHAGDGIEEGDKIVPPQLPGGKLVGVWHDLRPEKNELLERAPDRVEMFNVLVGLVGLIA